VLRRKRKDQFRVTGFVERLAPYRASALHVVWPDESVESELVERAATVIAVLPRSQRRETIEDLASPYDPERGRRAVDALIDTAFAFEDDAGRVRKVA
jgi:hypothetical protein